MKKVFIYVTACERRALDARRVHTYFLQNGYKIVNKPKKADIILYFCCGTVNEFIDTALSDIKNLMRYDAELIVSGCLPVIEKNKLSKIFNGKILETKNLGYIDDLFPENDIKFKSIDDGNLLYEIKSTKFLPTIFQIFFRNSDFIKKSYSFLRNHILKNLFDERSFVYIGFSKEQMYHIRISQGCKGNCSYCVIKKAVGPYISKPLDQCLDEFKKGLKMGFKRFIITAEDPGSYGADVDSSLPELLDEMTKIQGDYKLYIRHLNPAWFIKYYKELELISKRNKIIAFEIPIESGSSRILKLMRRYSDVDKMREILLEFKKNYPNISIITHLILGFPTESINEFEKSLFMIKTIEFDSGEIFPYSKKVGTDSYNIQPQLSQDEISHRIKCAKKYFKKNGYNIINLPQLNSFLFNKRKRTFSPMIKTN